MECGYKIYMGSTGCGNNIVTPTQQHITSKVKRVTILIYSYEQNKKLQFVVVDLVVLSPTNRHLETMLQKLI